MLHLVETNLTSLVYLVNNLKEVLYKCECLDVFVNYRKRVSFKSLCG